MLRARTLTLQVFEEKLRKIQAKFLKVGELNRGGIIVHLQNLLKCLC